MTKPQSLYRYRPCDDGILEREVEALEQSYLFAPPFSAMNDPMEAFLEVGDEVDQLFIQLAPQAADALNHFYGVVTRFVEKTALISFSQNHEALPLWAYYASNFAGFCLEFDPLALHYGALQGDQLHQVTYAERALPALSMQEMFRSREQVGPVVTSRLTRKRHEWAHEQEWRYITGVVGPKHYLDSALTRVFLGPRMAPAHAKRICAALKGRPVDILQGTISGYHLRFDLLQAATPPKQCPRVGIGRFRPDVDLFSNAELAAFLKVPFEELVHECERLDADPNMDGFADIGISAEHPDCLFIWTRYALRNNRPIHWRRWYDSRMRQVDAEDRHGQRTGKHGTH
ncbi:Protein of unknown function [Luteibacter sp. UNCMF331Sha3.1]|uniref:DUF2971 domain-containing protein n=1 Tax=Luteibacter sp. UNCMF331Sha3.1 TaxID=1502760 RepID=UPI0008D24EAE|nr:DUF2971 domain-containing protein [Luteibacter sp. UNCMF331Sha3.1]SEN10244.1 Protein of unknown function [Luteibacter sp. UNCMF331Sha3.1]